MTINIRPLVLIFALACQTAPDDNFVGDSAESGLMPFPSAQMGSAGSANKEALDTASSLTEFDGSAYQLTTREDTRAAIDLSLAAPGRGAKSYVVLRHPKLGRLEGVAPHLTYVPDADRYGTDFTSFLVKDAQGNTATLEVAIIVEPVNDPPRAEDITLTVPEDGATRVRLKATDPEGRRVSYKITKWPEHGILTGEAPKLVYRPVADYSGPDSMMWSATDGKTSTDGLMVTFDVAPRPDPVTAGESVVSTPAGMPVMIEPLIYDPDGDATKVTIITGPSHGRLVAQGTQLLYKPDSNFKGEEKLTFMATDGDSEPSTGAVTIRVGLDGDAAEAYGAMNAFPKAMSQHELDVADGVTVDLANGSKDYFSFRPAPAMQASPYGPASAPKPVADRFTATGNTALRGAGLLDNDSHPDGLRMAAVPQRISTAAGGILETAADGSFLYTPPPGVTNLVDTATYQVQDSRGSLTHAEVTFEVSGMSWWVDNTAAPEGRGSAEQPFASLAEAESASKPGDTIFVAVGDGSSRGYDTGFALKPGQQLLAAPAAGEPAVYGSARPANAWPRITGDGDVVLLADDAMVSGITLDAPDGSAITCDSAAGATIQGAAITQSLDAALHFSSCDDISVDELVIDGAAADGILVEGGENLELSSIEVVEPGGRGIALRKICGSTVLRSSAVLDAGADAVALTTPDGTCVPKVRIETTEIAWFRGTTAANGISVDAYGPGIITIGDNSIDRAIAGISVSLAQYGTPQQPGAPLEVSIEGNDVRSYQSSGVRVEASGNAMASVNTADNLVEAGTTSPSTRGIDVLTFDDSQLVYASKDDVSRAAAVGMRVRADGRSWTHSTVESALLSGDKGAFIGMADDAASMALTLEGNVLEGQLRLLAANADDGLHLVAKLIDNDATAGFDITAGDSAMDDPKIALPVSDPWTAVVDSDDAGGLAGLGNVSAGGAPIVSVDGFLGLMALGNFEYSFR